MENELKWFCMKRIKGKTFNEWKWFCAKMTKGKTFNEWKSVSTWGWIIAKMKVYTPWIIILMNYSEVWKLHFLNNLFSDGNSKLKNVIINLQSKPKEKLSLAQTKRHFLSGMVGLGSRRTSNWTSNWTSSKEKVFHVSRTFHVFYRKFLKASKFKVPQQSD
jgi:hypothetical protein